MPLYSVLLYTLLNILRFVFSMT